MKVLQGTGFTASATDTTEIFTRFLARETELSAQEKGKGRGMREAPTTYHTTQGVLLSSLKPRGPVKELTSTPFNWFEDWASEAGLHGGLQLWEALDKSLNLSKPPFLHLYHEDHKRTYLHGQGLNETIYVAHLAQCLAYKCPINFSFYYYCLVTSLLCIALRSLSPPLPPWPRTMLPCYSSGNGPCHRPPGD